jgi:hypothetical protein
LQITGIDSDQRGHEDARVEGSRFEQSCKLSLYTSPMMHGDRPDVIMRFASAVSSEEGEMSIFPTKILLATDGSSESELATRTAVDLGQQTNSELHLIHVWDFATTALLYPDATDPEGVELPDPILEEDLERSAEGQGSSRRGIGRSRSWVLPSMNIERTARTVPRSPRGMPIIACWKLKTCPGRARLCGYGTQCLLCVEDSMRRPRANLAKRTIRFLRQREIGGKLPLLLIW